MSENPPEGRVFPPFLHTLARAGTGKPQNSEKTRVLAGPQTRVLAGPRASTVLRIPAFHGFYGSEKHGFFVFFGFSCFSAANGQKMPENDPKSRPKGLDFGTFPYIFWPGLLSGSGCQLPRPGTREEGTVWDPL